MVTYSINNHSSIRLSGSKVVYCDPFMVTQETHDADIICITHEHGDHFSPDDILKVCKDDTLFIIPVSMKQVFDDSGIQGGGVRYIIPQGFATVLGLTIKGVPAYNIGKDFHPKEKGWLGYLIELDGESFYVVGDSDRTPEAEEVRCDVLFVPVGGTYTMTASEAVALANAIKPAIAVPTHYGAVVGSPADAQVFCDGLDKDIEGRILY